MQKKMPVGNGIYVEKKWTFNADVAKNFDSHIKKSVPLYDIGHEIILDFIELYMENSQNKNIIISDLGCSTGLLINKISHRFKDIPMIFYGIDKESSMLEIAQKRNYSPLHKIHWICNFLENYPIEKSDIIICYYILQFLPVSIRNKIINNIYNKLKKNGFFFLFEKIKYQNRKIENIYNKIIIKFKIKNQFTLEEIQNKEKSLKGILTPLTLKENFRLLNKAGFKNYETILQHTLFTGILSIK
jgi:tRNA (cmo5U34)-methyltransferase